MPVPKRHLFCDNSAAHRRDTAFVDVFYAVVAEFHAGHVPADEQVAVNDLLHRNEVVQVTWAKRPKPRPRPARPDEVLVVMLLFDHTATEQKADEVAQMLRGLTLVNEVRVERPGTPQAPDAAVAVTSPSTGGRPDPAAG